MPFAIDDDDDDDDLLSGIVILELKTTYSERLELMTTNPGRIQSHNESDMIISDPLSSRCHGKPALSSKVIGSAPILTETRFEDSFQLIRLIN